MNILWLNHRDPNHPKAGGAERTMYEITKRLVQTGNKVTIYCPKWHGADDEVFLDGIRIIRKGNSLTTHLILPIFLLKNHFDIVINDLAHGIPWISSVFLQRKNLIFFRHLHARSLNGQVNFLFAKIIISIEKLYPFFYRNLKVVTESSTSENDLIKLGFLKKNIVRIPPGIDLNLFSLGEKTENVQLIYFGGLRRYKRPEFVLKVFELLKNHINGLKIVVTGEGKLLEKIKKEALSKNYNIIFLGKIDQKELAKLIRESWINLHFSVTEGWGLSIIEASASGTPSVAFKVPGIVDTIFEGHNGFLTEDIYEFKNLVLKIISNEDFYIKESRNIAERFSWDTTAKNWNDLINETYRKQIRNK